MTDMKSISKVKEWESLRSNELRSAILKAAHAGISESLRINPQLDIHSTLANNGMSGLITELVSSGAINSHLPASSSQAQGNSNLDNDDDQSTASEDEEGEKNFQCSLM